MRGNSHQVLEVSEFCAKVLKTHPNGSDIPIFPDKTFAENSMNIASYLSQMPTKGLAFTKQLLSHSIKATFDEQLQDLNT